LILVIATFDAVSFSNSGGLLMVLPRTFRAILFSVCLASVLVPSLSTITPAQTNERGVFIKRGGVAPDGRGKLWAVVIGVSNYKNISAEAQLRFAHRDAQEFAAFLRSANGGGFPASQIKVLLNEGATLSAVRTSLGTWLPRSVEPDDVVYIFFAGHGVVEGERDGYLLAHDSDPQNLYATALPIAELDSILTQRLRARVVVLMADACHSGKIGWTSRDTDRQVLISRYLDEVGKSGAGVFRLLATRPDERSYEDTRWGGGHGVFTYFLLEGLRGKADHDKDGVIRAAELIDYIAQLVPEQTNALQHPQVAGNIDPRLPIAIISNSTGREASNSANPVKTHDLEVRGAPGSEVYVNNSYRGRIRPNGTLIVEGLKEGAVEVSLDSPGGEPISQTVALGAARTVVDLKAAPAPTAVIKSSPLVAQIRNLIAQGLVLGPEGGSMLYQRLVRENPKEPQRTDIEVSLSNALEEIGQRAISEYVNSSITKLSPDTFRRGAEAFGHLKMIRPSDPSLEPKHLFCQGRALIIENKIDEAIASLKKAVELDQRAAHSYNALGIAYEKKGENGRAQEAFEQAARLAPNWSLPRSHIGIHYYLRGQWERAEQEFKESLQRDSRLGFVRLMLVRLYRERERYTEAENEAANLIRQSPRYPPIYIELGLLYEKLKQFGKAASAFETYLELDPGSKDRDAIRDRIARNRRQAPDTRPRLKKDNK
jgi:Flp pilus assembly protein TadD